MDEVPLPELPSKGFWGALRHTQLNFQLAWFEAIVVVSSNLGVTRDEARLILESEIGEQLARGMTQTLGHTAGLRAIKSHLKKVLHDKDWQERCQLVLERCQENRNSA